MVGCRASFHRHNASRQLRHHVNKLGPRQLATEDHIPVARRRMQLERVFCEVDADDANFCHGCLLFCWLIHPSLAWHIVMPSGGGIHPIKVDPLSWGTVRKVLRSGETSFEYERNVQPRPKLGRWTFELERLLTSNAAKPARRTVRRRFEERFTAARMAKDYVNLYRKLLNNSKLVEPTSLAPLMSPDPRPLMSPPPGANIVRKAGRHAD
jgi:hypothetical protein